MMIDTHCHIDMFDDPIRIAKSYYRENTACVLTTMLPSHYHAALPHLQSFQGIYPALGMHPLRANEGQKEIGCFLNLAKTVAYIGEIGLDLSAEGLKTEKRQLTNLRQILPSVRHGKFVSVHSRDAHVELSLLLDEYSVGPVCFHYFTGNLDAASRIVGKGHFFSINHRMLTNKHLETINALPKTKILVETDGPFLTKRPLTMVRKMYDYLCESWGVSMNEVQAQLQANFEACRTQ